MTRMTVSGNVAVSAADVRAAVPLDPGGILTDSSVAAAAAAVTGLYRSRAFYGAEVTASVTGRTTAGDGAELAIAVREGVRAAFGRLELAGAGALPADVAAELFPLSPGDPLDPAAIDAGVAAILGWYEGAGYPFARAAVEGIDDAGGGSMTVTVAVDEGSPAVVSDIRVTGNAETRGEVVAREYRRALPSPYDPAAAGRFAARLRRLGIFSSVADPGLYRVREGSDTCGLLVAVTEGRTSTFDGILGYTPQGTGAGGFNGSVVLGFRNLFGTARRFDASWARPGGTTQEIRVAYEEPWAFGVPVNLSGAFAQRRQDSAYVDTRWRIEAEYLATASLSLSGILEWQGVVPSSGPAGAGIVRSDATTGGAALRYDTRDDREVPRSGADFRTEYRSGRKTTASGGGGRSVIQHVGFDFALFIPVRRSQVLTLALHGREVVSDSAGPADLYRLGGFRTLRGFREEQFSGVRTAWGTAEYRFLAGGRSFFYGFFDPGYVLPPDGAGDFFTYGFGVGIRIETAVGLVGVSFALGEGDPIAQTKIHFGLINDF